MTTKKPRPKTIADYINAAPKEAQKKLREIRVCIRKAAPGATEGIKWAMPAFSHKRILVMFAAFKNHIGFYPTPSAVKAFAKDLAKFHTAKGSIQFPFDKPLPLPLIRKITAFRVRESLKQDKKWRT
ncbi:MAG: iron chaperone [Candidatus Acidiferrum sp.]